jgi:predicted aconitase with swiveling domain
MTGSIMFAGAATGPVLVLDRGLSFWGGVDPKTGMILDVRHPQCGKSVAGTILSIAEPIGSSSSSAVLLELIAAGVAPAAIVLGRADAILVVGCLAGREMDYVCPPIIIDRLPDWAGTGTRLALDATGSVVKWTRMDAGSLSPEADEAL